MIESFFTIDKPASGIYKEKGSKFLAFAHPVTDSEQIKSILTALRKEYYDGRHHCYAWILDADKSKFKAFDDGEPNHSAGDPILNQIKSKHLTNILVVVVRYFGGVKLGVSGLTTAYKTAASEALKAALIIEKHITKNITLQYGYPETSLIKNILKEFGAIITHESFTEDCTISFDVSIAKEESVRNRVETLQLQGTPITLLEK